MLLEVPASIMVVSEDSRGGIGLYICGGGAHTVVPLPVTPYRWVEVSEENRSSVTDIRKVKLFGRTRRETYIGKQESETVPLTRDREMLQFDYILQVILDYPEKIRELVTPLGGPLEPFPLFIDIETASDDSGKSSLTDGEILSVQLKYPERDQIFLYQNSQCSEMQLLRDLMEVILKDPVSGKSPDFVCGFNCNMFDVPFIDKRLARYGLLQEWAGKLNRLKKGKVHWPFWMRSARGKNAKPEHTYTSAGIGNLDLYIHAKSDPNLADLPSRGLKPTSIKYGGTDVEDLSKEEKRNMKAVFVNHFEKFKKYALSDIYQTELVYDVYSKRVIAMANQLSTSMLLTHRMSSGQQSFVPLYREVCANGFFPLQDNNTRYGDIYDRAKKYEGALVACRRTGYFNETIYVDCKCIHPDTEVLTSTGYKRIGDVREGERLYSDRGYGKVAYVTAAKRHSLVTITTKSGNTITVSEEHRFPVYMKHNKHGYSEKDEITVKRAGDLSESDLLLECYNYTFEGAEPTVSSAMTDTALLLGIYDAEGYMYEGTRTRIRHDRHDSLQFDVRYTQISFTIHVKEQKLRDQIIMLMETHTRGKASVLCREGKNTLVLQYGDHEVFDRFRNVLPKQEVLLQSRRMCAAYLRGLFSGDGTYNRARRTVTLVQSSVNKHIIDLAHKCLVRCGIPHSVSAPQKAIAVAKDPAESTEHLRYIIEIPTLYVPLYMKQIGFIEDKHVPDNLPLTKPKQYVREGYQITGIRSIVRRTQETEMVDLTMENQEYPYFFANHILTHNSMYPNIMYDFNLSPDRYEVVEILTFDDYSEKYGYHEYVLRAEGPLNARIIDIPDNNYRTVFRIVIDLTEDGYMRRLIRKYNGIRDEYKRHMKSYEGNTTPEGAVQYRIYDAIQFMAKIINNTFYGLQGNRYYGVGDLPIAIFITAMGRWIMSTMINYFGDAVIGVDTDGILLDVNDLVLKDESRSKAIRTINDDLRRMISEKFAVPLSDMKFELEFEGEGSVYMYKEKNYFLRKNRYERETGKRILDGKDKATIKGSSFKGYNKAPVLRRAVEIMARSIMFNQRRDFEDSWKECLAIDNLDIEMFQFSQTVRRNAADYKNKSMFTHVYSSVDFSSTKTAKEAFTQMKRAARDYLKSVLKDQKWEDRDYYRSLLISSRSLQQLHIAIRSIDTFCGTLKTPHFMVELMRRRSCLGKQARIDDTIEYFYSAKGGFVLAEEVTSKHDIDIERYRKEIEKLLIRFKYADPVEEDLNASVL